MSLTRETYASIVKKSFIPKSIIIDSKPLEPYFTKPCDAKYKSWAGSDNEPYNTTYESWVFNS